MIAKRIGAIVLAALLIAAAWVIRDRVIESDGDTDTTTRPADEQAEAIACARELRAACEAAVNGTQVRVVLVDVDAEFDRLVALPDGEQPMVWVTFGPYPEMVNTVRELRQAEPISYTSPIVASSPLTLVVRPESTQALTTPCGDPVELACLGQQRDLKPTFAPLTTGIGTLSVAAAVSAYGNGLFLRDDPQFLVWARGFKSAGAASLSGGTAIGTIQTRPTFDVAIGAEAELTASKRAEFDVLYAEPMAHLDVNVMIPSGVDVPDGLLDALSAGLLDRGWVRRDPVERDGLPDAGTIVAVHDFWDDL